jgi:hypothetical protein
MISDLVLLFIVAVAICVTSTAIIYVTDAALTALHL